MPTQIAPGNTVLLGNLPDQRGIFKFQRSGACYVKLSDFSQQEVERQYGVWTIKQGGYCFLGEAAPEHEVIVVEITDYDV